MSLKILMTTMSLGIGGAETHIVELAKALRRRGVEVVIASNGGVFVADVEKAGITHYKLPMHRRDLRCMVKSYFLLRRIIKKEKPDLVHAHARIPAFLCGLLEKTLHFPFITTAHAVFQLGFSLNRLTNWGRKTIAISDDIRRYLIDNYGVSDSNIVMTINGIDTEKFSPAVSPERIRREFGIDPTHPVIVHVQRIDEASTVVTRQLIEITPALDSALPGVQLLIAGGGDVFDEVKALADAANAAVGRRVVIMAGPRMDINEIVSAGNVFVGVSRAALEAMAEAKPVILAGSEGYIGLLAPDNAKTAQLSNFCGRGCGLPESRQLLDEIVRCLTTLPEDRLRELGDFGRQMILRDYSVDRMTDDCMAVYEAVRRPRYNVVMSGYYGVGNAGDEALLQSIHQNIKSSGGGNAFTTGSDVTITVLSSDPADTKARYGYDAVNRFRFFDVIRALRRCDALVSGGGSLLQDLTSTRSLVYYLMIIRLAMLFGKKVMIYANGIAVRKKRNRALVRRIVRHADVITLRDEVSASELRGMGIDRRDMRVTADPVFTLSGLKSSEAVRLLEDAGVPADRPFFCFSVRKWAPWGPYYEKLAEICDEVYDRYGRNIVFLPMQTPDDIDASREVMKRMKRPAFVLNRRYTAEETMGIISLSELVVAMRLHALIFAARMSVPLVGLNYDPKVTAYINALGMLSAGDVSSFDGEKALSAIISVMSDRDKYIEIIKTRTAELEQLAREDARLLLELLEKPKRKRQ
jgi:polysaccharide pyruvyl transferase CsaB